MSGAEANKQLVDPIVTGDGTQQFYRIEGNTKQIQSGVTTL